MQTVQDLVQWRNSSRSGGAASVHPIDTVVDKVLEQACPVDSLNVGTKQPIGKD